jgi:hypothetical protein
MKSMPQIPDISVIIPSNHGHNELLNIVHAIICQSTKPLEIVIVDSSIDAGICPKDVTKLCADGGIKLIYVHKVLALPGDARNIGLGMASGDLIGLIDVQTIPRSCWLEAAVNLLSSHDVDGVWGATYFNAETKFERLVRDGFFGVLPRKTLPGSVFRRKVFEKSGEFIDWVRAGEDTEWMLRLEQLKVPVLNPSSALIDYVGLVGLDLQGVIRKWFRNYTASRELPQFFPQKMLLWLTFYPLLILIAFNWNYLIADWSTDSPYYLSHVTKMAVIVPPLLYFFLRGFLLPQNRGVGIWRLLPFRFMMIILICMLADAVKILVFSVPQRPLRAITKALAS